MQNSGVISAKYDSGVTTFHALSAIRNHGTIAQTGVDDPFYWSCGIKVVNGARIENSGLITGTHSGIRISDAASMFSLINSGTISGGFAGLDITDMTDFAPLFSIINTGTISGGTMAFARGSEVTSLINSGTLIGTVDLGSGADYLDTSRGTILGNVFLGDGDDMLKAYGATLDSDVYGGLGSDTYFVDGQIGIGEEAALGEIDIVIARCDFDLAENIERLLLLGTGNYRGRGNADANEVVGNSGNNSLHGMAGNDTMTGGTGADRFVFSILTHSAAAEASADIITYFLAGEDLIDLSAIDANRPNARANDVFAFIGLAAFSGVAGQLRYLQSGGRTFLQMDVDGDSVADATIRLNDLITLNAGDLIL